MISFFAALWALVRSIGAILSMLFNVSISILLGITARLLIKYPLAANLIFSLLVVLAAALNALVLAALINEWIAA